MSGTDIKPEERRAILELHARLPTLNHFELLGVDRRADPTQIKEAYLERSRLFHPDRFFKEQLADLRQAAEEIFRRLKEAELTLSDPARRKAYLEAHPEVKSEKERAEEAIIAKRRAERSARLRRLDPLARRALSAVEMVARGRKQLEEGAYRDALSSFSLAASLGGKGPELERLTAQAAQKAQREQARSLLQSAKKADAGDPASVQQLLEAATLAEGEITLQLEALNLFLDRGGEPAHARALVSKILVAAPDNADAHALQGRLLLAAGHEKAAHMALDRALKLDPNQPLARSVRRKPRWPFK